MVLVWVIFPFLQDPQLKALYATVHGLPSGGTLGALMRYKMGLAVLRRM